MRAKCLIDQGWGVPEIGSHLGPKIPCHGLGPDDEVFETVAQPGRR